jgi:hypothetical protein
VLFFAINSSGPALSGVRGTPVRQVATTKTYSGAIAGMYRIYQTDLGVDVMRGVGVADRVRDVTTSQWSSVRRALRRQPAIDFRDRLSLASSNGFSAVKAGPFNQDS